MDNEITYIQIMITSLKKKQEVLEQLVNLTKIQDALLSKREFDMDSFDETLEEKEILIKNLEQLDDGFETIFKNIKIPLSQKKEKYHFEIIQIQELIHRITDFSMKIEVLEKSNKIKLQICLTNKRKDIKQFNVSSKTATSYYKNMGNQHQEWQTYFLDKKN